MSSPRSSSFFFFFTTIAVIKELKYTTVLTCTGQERDLHSSEIFQERTSLWETFRKNKSHRGRYARWEQRRILSTIRNVGWRCAMNLWKFSERHISPSRRQRSRMRWHFDGFGASRCLTLLGQKRVKTRRTRRESKRASEWTNEWTSEWVSEWASRRTSDRKLSISKSIWPGLPIGCRLISRWIVSNMGILLMARRGIGCTSNRGLQPRSRALPKSIARGWRYALAFGIPD